MKPFVKKVLAYLVRQLNPEPKNPAIILIGDSLIRMGNWKELLNRSDFINRGIGGETLSQIHARLKQLADTTARIAFIEGGINDLPPSDADTLLAEYQEMATVFQSKQLIPVITSLVCISPQAAKKYPWRSDWRAINTQVTSLNEKLKAFCGEKNIDFIDLNSLLSDSVQLQAEYTTDGVHLTESAYRIWAAEAIRILQKYQI
ncbi:hypothetical protein GCM10028808_34230 [Spirosoma migulaei]